MITYQTENIGKSYEYRSNCHENWIVPPHIHEYSELAFTKEGATTVYVDGTKYTVPTNHLIFIRPNQIHEYTNETESSMRCAVFSNDFVPLFYSAMVGKELKEPVIDFSDCAHILLELDQASPQDSLKICGLLNIICFNVLKRGNPSPLRTGTQGRNACLRIIEYISSSFREDISLSDLAKRLGYNEKYLSSTLHSLTGMNFRKFLSSYRIDYAKSLLRSDTQGHLRMSDVAMQCGFSSINTFNRMFLSLCGVTPLEYKKQSLQS